MKECSKNQRIQKLRGTAFLLVFVSHCAIIYGADGNNLMKYFGAFGVEIFIILSGYLAFKYYPTAVSYIEYCKNKISKVMLLHIITLVIAIPLCLPITKSFIPKIIINLLLLQVWFPKNSIYFSLNSVSWYLGINTFFILLTPFIIKRIRNIKYNRYKFLSILIIFQIVEIIITILSHHLTSVVDTHWLIYICPITRLLDFIGGGIAYIMISNIQHFHNYRKLRRIGIIFGCVMMILSLVIDNEFFSVAGWFLPTLLIVSGICEDNTVKECILSKIGNISFELFLFHQLIIRYIECAALKIHLYNRIIIFIISLISSIAISFVYHNIMYNLKKRR